MKRLIFLLLLAATFTACNDDDNAGYRFLDKNPFIEGGHLSGHNLHFYGTSTVRDAQGNLFTDNEAYFEFAGLDDICLYMHKTRFAAAMPGVEMRFRNVSYVPTGDVSLSFSEQELIPEARRDNETGGGSSYVPVERYRITGLEGSIDGVVCRVKFTCAGIYDVVYEGRLVEML